MSSFSIKSIVRNRLLQQLRSEDLELLQPFLEPVTLNVDDVLIVPDTTIEYIHFIEQGLCSVIAVSAHERIEVGHVGREGFAGSPILLDVDSTPHLTFTQIAGSALRMRTEDFRSVVAQSPSLRGLLLRYVHSTIIQVGQTALSNGRAKIEIRLARWILMCHDRLDDDEVPLTHQILGLMLGVRRSGVTTALHILEAKHIIKARRGRVTVLDRNKLVEFAADSYGIAEAEYARVIGVQIRRTDAGV